MTRTKVALVLAAAAALACSGTRQEPARGPQAPESPVARHTAPLESAPAVEASAGYSKILTVPLPGQVLPLMQSPMGQRPGPSECPMAQPGIDVRSVELGTAGALEFRAPGASRTALEASVDRLAEAYIRRAPLERGVPLYRVRFEPTRSGVRIVFEPTDPSRLENLRRDLVEHAGAMREYRYCPVT